MMPATHSSTPDREREDGEAQRPQIALTEGPNIKGPAIVTGPLNLLALSLW
jgi:hypothetical protein